MIEVSFYKNGFEINGHTIPEICYQVSILAWSFANLIGDEEKYEWYTHEVGYTHCVYTPSNGRGDWYLYRFKQMITTWAEYYKWQEDGHIKIVESDELLVIPDNFKVLKGIEQPIKTLIMEDTE